MKKEIDALRVVIPAYNAAHSLRQLLIGISKYVNPDQIIVVDDGSQDRTLSVAHAFGTRMLRHEVNRGKGAALKSGLEAAFSEPGVFACVTMDADGQHEPDFIPAFIEAFKVHYGDLVIGSRLLDLRVMPAMRVLSNRMTSALIGFKLGQRVQDSQCGYRLISRKVFSTLDFDSNGFEFETEMLLKAGRARMKILWTPISTLYGSEKSNIKSIRDTLRFIKTLFK